VTLRQKLIEIVEARVVNRLILAVILFNAVLMGLETSDAVMARAGGVIAVLDGLCLAVFVTELAAKLVAHGRRFFLQGWNVFDLIVVGIALAPATQGLSVLRALRVLRVLRVISVSASLRRVVEGFVRALPGMAWVFLLMGIIFYIASVMATQLYGDTVPERFGTLAASALTLFQVMTLEGWADGVVRPAMEIHPYAWAFFIPFILVTTFAVVNLLVGLVVNSMQDAAEAEREADLESFEKEVLRRLEGIEARLGK
jgi:voltage-gated sodium channel